MSKIEKVEKTTAQINSDEPVRLKKGQSALVIGGYIFMGAMLGYFMGHGSGQKVLDKVPASVEKKIQAELPATTFVEFNQTDYGMIEGITKKNSIFYFDQKGSVAFVGELMDLENKIPVTVERKRNLKLFANLDGGIGGNDADVVRNGNQPAPRAPEPAEQAIAKVSDLKPSNYIVHNEGAGEILYVVSDFSCGFCRRLHNELKDVTDIEIREIPVRFLRDDSAVFGAHALCADNPSQTAADIFDGIREGIKTCQEGEQAVIFNTQWASQNGVTGTPALITEDGRVSSGFRELARIRALLGS